MIEGKPTCVIDKRVSSQKQVRGGGLEDQEALGRMTAARLGIPEENIIKIFTKSHSATTTDRDDIEEIIEYIRNFTKETGVKIDYYIMKSIDRFTREGYPEYLRLKDTLESMGVTVRDAYGVIQSKQNTLAHLGDFKYKWSTYSPSEASEMLESYRGKTEARDILTRMIGAEIKLVQEGYAVRRPIDGMVNKKVFINGKDKTIREPDLERSHFFTRMFEMRAEGLDDKNIIEKINSMGFKTKIQKRYNKRKTEIIGHRGGVPLTVKQLQRFIETPEYAGVRCEKWTQNKPIRAQYAGLVSISLWNAANRGKKYIQENEDGSLEILLNYNSNRTKKKLKHNPLYPWKCVRCHLCKNLGKDKPFLASAPVGKSGENFPTYHCGRDHKYFGVPKKQFEDTIENFVKNLKFNTDFLNGFELTFLNKYRKREREVVGDSAQIHQSIADLKTQQVSKIRAIEATTSQVVRSKLEMEVEELELKIKKADQERIKIRITENDIKGFIRWCKNLMEHPSEWLLDPDNTSSKEALFDLIFEEMPTYLEILNGTPKLSLVFKLSSEFTTDKNQLVM